MTKKIIAAEETKAGKVAASIFTPEFCNILFDWYNDKNSSKIQQACKDISKAVDGKYKVNIVLTAFGNLILKIICETGPDEFLKQVGFLTKFDQDFKETSSTSNYIG